MYAKDTTVSVEKSKGEIEKLASKYGADQFMSGWKETMAVIGFTMQSRQIRFTLPLPEKTDKRFMKRSTNAGLKAWEQECRSKWRSLFLVIKAKLEAVESGITTFEEEFLAHIVLPDNRTVGQWMTPQLKHIYATRQMPGLLLSDTSTVSK